MDSLKLQLLLTTLLLASGSTLRNESETAEMAEFSTPDGYQKKMVELKLELLQILAEMNKKNVSQEMKDKIRNDPNVDLGDMKLTFEQYKTHKRNADQVKGRLETRNSRQRVAALDFKKVPHKRWTEMPIKYLTTAIANQQMRDVIQEAIADIEEKSDGCIKFEKVEQKPPSSFIFFQDRPQIGDYVICGNSPVGRQYHGNFIVLSTDPSCLTKVGVVHEIFHSLGFDHTQNRLDRDEYVRIQMENVRKDEDINFLINNETLAHGGEYDFNSIMHYFANANSIDLNKPTIVPLLNKEKNIETMGQATEMSKLDVNMLKRLYCSPVIEKGAPCLDSLRTCAEIKEQVCGLDWHSELFGWALTACRDTCQLCDKYPPKFNDTPLCADMFDDCFRIVNERNCDSTDPQIRMRAHILCPRACGVCAKPTPENSLCKDAISTCNEFGAEACAVRRDSGKLFNFMVAGCRRTCHLCEYYAPKDDTDFEHFCDFAVEDCSQRVQAGDCTATDLNKRMQAHLLCSPWCKVCTEPH